MHTRICEACGSTETSTERDTERERERYIYIYVYVHFIYASVENLGPRFELCGFEYLRQSSVSSPASTERTLKPKPCRFCEQLRVLGIHAIHSDG